MFLSGVSCEIMSGVKHCDVEDPKTEKFQKYVTYNNLLLEFATQRRSYMILPETMALKTKHPSPPEILMIFSLE